jgi:hypothetical protein
LKWRTPAARQRYGAPWRCVYSTDFDGSAFEELLARFRTTRAAAACKGDWAAPEEVHPHQKAMAA